MRRELGVALVLVLMIVGVLSLLMLQLGLTARQQVSQARQVVDRAEAELIIHSVESEVRFNLLTRPWATDFAENEHWSVTNVWNFRGQPFSVGRATVCLQDVSGLIPLPAQRGDLTEFSRLLGVLQFSDERISAALARLRASMDSPGWIPLQSPAELGIIMGLTRDELSKLEKIATLYPSTAFNPMTAPTEVLQARYSRSAADAVTILRAQNSLTEQSFSLATGVAFDDFVITNPGPVVRLDVRSKVREATVRRQTVWLVEPRSLEPLVLWSSRSPSEGVGDTCRV